MKSETLTGLLGVVVGGLIGAVATYFATQREAEVKMIEIAVGILAAKPEDSIKPAREWAVKVLDYYSDEVPLTDEIKRALLNHPLPVRGAAPDPLEGTGALGTVPFGTGVMGGPPP